VSDQRSRPMATATPVPGEEGDNPYDDPWFKDTGVPRAPKRVEAAPHGKKGRMPGWALSAGLLVGIGGTTGLLLLFLS